MFDDVNGGGAFGKTVQVTRYRLSTSQNTMMAT
jgi:hypothetical protein